MKLNIPKEYEKRTLKEFLYEKLNISRGTLTKLKKLPEGIILNGERVTVRAVLAEGDILSLQLDDGEADENEYVIPSGECPPILYEDEAVIAFEKPYGMPTHTSHDHLEGCLANAVCAYFKSQGKPFVFRAVNRLDLDTSGIVLVAKNRYYASLLSRSLMNGEFDKSYIAVLDGVVPSEGEIEGYISRCSDSIIKRQLSDIETEGSDYSKTVYRRISCANEKSAVLATPVTGRTHQLRLHFSSIGAPICGDFLYGCESADIKRQALHAYSLTFPSPVAGRITVKSNIPEDMIALCKKYNLELNL